MGRIPQRFIDDLLARADIVEVIEQYVPLTKRGREHVACCPFHSEKTPSFTVSQDKQFYHCFGCGAHGTALGFLLDYERLEFVEAVEALASRIGLEVPRERINGSPLEKHGTLYAVLEKAARVYRQALRESPHAIDYLKKRGLSGKTAREYGVGYAPEDRRYLLQHFDEASMGDLARAGLIKQDERGGPRSRFWNRIMFPIRDRRGRVIGFGGRVLDDGVPKYMNSPETPLFNKSESLYGLYEFKQRQRKPERILLVEGYMDVLALAQQDVHNAVATLGTATTRQHLQQIFRLTHEVVFCFDGDRAGREAAWRALEQLLPIFRDGLAGRFMFLPEGDDPDSLVQREGREAFMRRAATAAPLSDYLFEHLAEGIDARDTAGRARLAELARPLLKKLPDGVFKELLYKELAQRTGASVTTLAPPVQRDTTHNRVAVASPVINSPVRMAIAILLQAPAVAQQSPRPPRLESLALPGISLLVQMLETLQTDPHLTAASLLERFRDSEHYRHLLQLASWQPPVPETFDFEAAFRDTMASLSAKAAEQLTNALLSKERDAGLSSGERYELQELLRQRRDTNKQSREDS